jgi:hypothetical protein
MALSKIIARFPIERRAAHTGALLAKWSYFLVDFHGAQAPFNSLFHLNITGRHFFLKIRDTEINKLTILNVEPEISGLF